MKEITIAGRKFTLTPLVGDDLKELRTIFSRMGAQSGAGLKRVPIREQEAALGRLTSLLAKSASVPVSQIPVDFYTQHGVAWPAFLAMMEVSLPDTYLAIVNRKPQA